MSPENVNVFAALRAAFPGDLSLCAVEMPGGLRYSWHDLDAASGMVANLLTFLDLSPGARVAVQVEPSVESLVLYLAVLRAGLTYVPFSVNDSLALRHGLQVLQPAMVVCAGHQFGEVSKMAFLAGVAYVFSLNADRTGTLLERAARFPPMQVPALRQADDVAVLMHADDASDEHVQWTALSHSNLRQMLHEWHGAWHWLPDGGLLERMLKAIDAVSEPRR